MHTHKGILVEERGRRAVGITRGDIGRFDATALCGGDQEGAGRVSRRQITDGERERARILGAYDRHSEVAPGAIQGIAQQQAMGYAVERLVKLATLPQQLPTGPAMIEPARRGFKPGPAKVTERKPRASVVKAAAAERQRAESEYDRMLGEARAGLDMKNPRHVERFKTRLERAREAAAQGRSLNAYIEAERACGRSV